ncbi:MAG: hypothetical protein LBV38_02370 [Alistipes sp.]|jgi:hypothetical protein|nr:hypothetical protein [Alistipes sp.]
MTHENRHDATGGPVSNSRIASRRAAGRAPRHPSEIRTLAELRDARRELRLREWYAARRLEDNAARVLHPRHLLSALAPADSFAGRVIDGLGAGISTAQTLISTAQTIFATAQPLFAVIRPLLSALGITRDSHPERRRRPRH